MVLMVIGVMVIYACLWALLQNYLKQRHPETWTKLGSPTFFLNNSVRNQWLVLGFLIQRKYTSLNDPTLNWLADLALLSFAAVLAVMVLIFFHVGPFGRDPVQSIG